MPQSPPEDVELRVATPADRLDVRRVLDGALLTVADLPERLAAGEVLVATARETVCGAVVVATAGPDDAEVPEAWAETAHVRAVAVRRRRRRAGVGSALVSAAADRYGPLVADFDESLAPFYEALGAELRPESEERCWARVPASP